MADDLVIKGRDCEHADHMCIRCYGAIVNYPSMNFTQQLSQETMRQDIIMQDLLLRNPECDPDSCGESEIGSSRSVAATRKRVSQILRKIIKSQALVRGFLARQGLQRFFRLKNSVTQIQSFVRMHLVAGPFRKLRNVVRVQKKLRQYFV